ncbi:hypothetical protein DFH09DRAFT_1090848 [Mycena vulgaris]|nr:hypothetical protein DFH09DRAFT_1090848 [Mycena vulgaris]
MATLIDMNPRGMIHCVLEPEDLEAGSWFLGYEPNFLPGLHVLYSSVLGTVGLFVYVIVSAAPYSALDQRFVWSVQRGIDRVLLYLNDWIGRLPCYLKRRRVWICNQPPRRLEDHAIVDDSPGGQTLPPELEQKIFERAVLSRSLSIPTLMRIARAWRVKHWVEPLLYRTLVVGIDEEDLATGLPLCDLHTFKRIARTKSPKFPRDFVRNLMIYLLPAEESKEILSICTAVENLWIAPTISSYSWLSLNSLGNITVDSISCSVRTATFSKYTDRASLPTHSPTRISAISRTWSSSAGYILATTIPRVGPASSGLRASPKWELTDIIVRRA